MRIRGSGTGSSGFGGSWSRSDSFRRKHRIGQKVHGVLLKNLPDNMAWVEIGGDRLLAQLEVVHPEGSRLVFVVKKLTPHIELKELRRDMHGGGPNVLSLASDFDTARTLFETAFRAYLRDNQDQALSLTHGTFFEIIATQPELSARYQDAANCARTLTDQLSDETSRFLYQPWLAPECRRQVTFTRQSPDSGITETIIEFDHPDMGLVRTEFLHRDTRVVSKVKLQHMAHSKALLRYLASRSHSDLGMDIETPTLVKLPPQSHGGIIAERLLRNQS